MADTLKEKVEGILCRTTGAHYDEAKDLEESLLLHLSEDERKEYFKRSDLTRLVEDCYAAS